MRGAEYADHLRICNVPDVSWDAGQHSGGVSVWRACHIVDGRRQGATSNCSCLRMAAGAANQVPLYSLHITLEVLTSPATCTAQVVQHASPDSAVCTTGANLRQQAGSIQAAQGHKVSTIVSRWRGQLSTVIRLWSTVCTLLHAAGAGSRCAGRSSATSGPYRSVLYDSTP